jgi:hypothetical protein
MVGELTSRHHHPSHNPQVLYIIATVRCIAQHIAICVDSPISRRSSFQGASILDEPPADMPAECRLESCRCVMIVAGTPLDIALRRVDDSVVVQ